MSEEKIDLIAKLLAKAERTTPEEAEALTAAAEKLMVKYAIDQAVIDERRAREGKKSEQIIERKVVFQGMYADMLEELAGNVIWALGSMRPLVAGRSGRRVVFIVGFESDVLQAEVLIRSLHLQVMVALKTWWHSVRNTDYLGMPERYRRRARLSYVHGFGLAVHARIRESRLRTVQEAGSGTDLVLVSRQARVNEFVDGLGINDAERPEKPIDPFARLHGFHDGKEANTGEKSMDQGRGLPAGRS